MIINGVIDTTFKEQILYQLRRYNFDTGYLKIFSIESNNGRILMDYDFSNGNENKLELVIDNFKDTTIYVKYVDTTKSLIDTTQNSVDTIPYKDSLIPKTITDYTYSFRYKSSDKKKIINKLYEVLNCDYLRYH